MDAQVQVSVKMYIEARAGYWMPSSITFCLTALRHDLSQKQMSQLSRFIYLCPLMLSYRNTQLCLDFFYVGLEDLISGPHACRASTSMH